MLISAFGVVASTTNRLKLTERLLRIYLMTVSHREKATGNISREARMITVRLKHAKRAFVRNETHRLDYIGRRRNLHMV
jgi:hypothetical protein